MIIFLDVDGVLNKESDWRKPFALDMSCVKALSELTSRLKASVVLTSTWRAGASSDGNNSPQYDHLISTLSDNGITVSGNTPVTVNKTREEEIDYYIRRNQVTEYLVIDDDPQLFNGGLRLYLTDYKTGLTKADIPRIIKMLKKGGLSCFLC